jgi:ubiquitin
MQNLEQLIAAGITLPVRLSKAEHGPLIKKAFEEGSLMRQVQMRDKPNQVHGPGLYRGPDGPCAIGAVIPEALGRWIDAGNADRNYSVGNLEGVIDCGADRDWFNQVQSAHDGGTEISMRRLENLLSEV